MKGIKRQLGAAMKNVSEEISNNSRGGLYAGGLASEGYAGGYRDALNDVLLALNGVCPNSRFWPAPRAIGTVVFFNTEENPNNPTESKG